MINKGLQASWIDGGSRYDPWSFWAWDDRSYSAGKVKKYLLTRDPLANYNLDLSSIIRIAEGLYHTSVTFFKNAFNVDSKVVTVKVG